MAKFTFTQHYMERQPGPKRHYKDWRAGRTYTMTKDHAHQLQEKGYGRISEVAGRDQETDSPVNEWPGTLLRDDGLNGD